jgi:hypothetical protein
MRSRARGEGAFAFALPQASVAKGSREGEPLALGLGANQSGLASESGRLSTS